MKILFKDSTDNIEKIIEDQLTQGKKCAIMAPSYKERSKLLKYGKKDVFVKAAVICSIMSLRVDTVILLESDYTEEQIYWINNLTFISLDPQVITLKRGTFCFGYVKKEKTRDFR